MKPIYFEMICSDIPETNQEIKFKIGKKYKVKLYNDLPYNIEYKNKVFMIDYFDFTDIKDEKKYIKFLDKHSKKIEIREQKNHKRIVDRAKKYSLKNLEWDINEITIEALEILIKNSKNKLVLNKAGFILETLKQDDNLGSFIVNIK